ncbi:urea ABC transporter ATP-binding subunit UrtE [Halotalea alkalilenta]|uniref:ABC transporter ATP-binding protein n=1 Tax=Halotalea alkalilenta TaxID=376489 RepID=A0A172YKI4_9GAMM|nr:urea ABC transporter ATP-binding subunit UrtE [Halotalea alkalilenta]ANF59778.1 ABC transporter ATP-binding protein [Halotalea alkalilenta]
MLSIDKIDQFYGESHTLWGLELEVAQRQCTCVLGRNGVGKTTMLKAVMGEVPIRGGKLLFDGTDISRLPIEARPRLGIGYVPQGRQIFPLLSVEENLRTGLGIGRSKRIPERIYELFPVLLEMRGRRGGDLSGGQQQQLAIARALTLAPRLLILDEPGEGIQPNIVTEIGRVLRRLIDEDGLTVLLVEQKLPFARRYADRFALIDRGRNVAEGPIESLSDELVARHLGI